MNYVVSRHNWLHDRQLEIGIVVKFTLANSLSVWFVSLNLC